MDKFHQNEYSKGRIVIVDWKKAKIVKNSWNNLAIVFQYNGEYKWEKIENVSKSYAESLHARKETQKKYN